MKRIYILLIMILTISLASCGCAKIKMSDNPEILKYGETNKYSFVYDGEIFYHVPTSIVVDVASDIKKGKFTVCNVHLNKDGYIQGIEKTRTYIIKRNDPILITLYEGKDTYVDKDGKTVTYIAWYQAIMLYEGTDIYMDIKKKKA